MDNLYWNMYTEPVKTARNLERINKYNEVKLYQ